MVIYLPVPVSSFRHSLSLQLGLPQLPFKGWLPRRFLQKAPFVAFALRMTSERFRQWVGEYQDQAWLEQVLDKSGAGLRGDAD